MGRYQVFQGSLNAQELTFRPDRVGGCIAHLLAGHSSSATHSVAVCVKWGSILMGTFCHTSVIQTPSGSSVQISDFLLYTYWPITLTLVS